MSLSKFWFYFMLTLPYNNLFLQSFEAGYASNGTYHLSFVFALEGHFYGTVDLRTLGFSANWVDKNNPSKQGRGRGR